MKRKDMQSLVDGVYAEEEKPEGELRFLKEFSEKIVDSIGDALLVIDPNDYTIVGTNEVALKQLKLRKEDMIGKTCYETTHHRLTPCKPPHHTCPINEMLQTGKTVIAEHTHFDKDNNEIYAEISAHPVRNQEGKIIRVVHIARDITERKKAEQALSRSEEKYRSIIESAPDGIVTANMKGVITSCNTAMAKSTGYSKDEIIGKHFSKLGMIRARDIPKYLKVLASTVRGKVPKPFEVTWQSKDGTLGFAEVRVNLMKENGNTIGIQTITRDITERKQMEDKLRHYSEHLEELVEERAKELKESQEQLLKSQKLAAIGEVATMVGHDLRNPLQSIENATYYLNTKLSHLPIPPKTMEMLQVINNSVNYADKIIRDLQVFSAARKPMLKKANINTIVKETLSLATAPENIELITELSPLPKIEADKDMIKRVFLNIIMNGIQAMENGGTLKVSTKKTEGFVEVSFKDTGIGMPRENMEKIFTPFFTTKAKGLGMGLPICKKFVDAHGGNIGVESDEGEGSTFTVKLPIQ